MKGDTNMETLNCTKCNGSGTRTRYDNTVTTCHYCDGKGTFPKLNLDEILATIACSRGKSKGRFRKSWPSKLNAWRNHGARRAYYVWRIARFHGGVDVTMPMTASFAIEGDPCRDMLDYIAGRVAQRVFGTNLAGTARWGALLGRIDPKDIPEGLPGSAYEGGPVHDGTKPEWEQLELR